MLKRYKTVSIVYGGSGAHYADRLNSLIIARSDEGRYPIASKIVMENILTGDLLINVSNLFEESEFCVTFLTADDCCTNQGKTVYRVRQNVLFELGMAIFRLGRERCILLSDFDPHDPNVELPSDLKGLDIKSFTPENQEQVFEDVLNKILQMTGTHKAIPQYDHLLNRNDYFVDYEDLLADSSHLAIHEGSEYLKGVLKDWKEECISFSHYEERCLYFFERIGFLPMFGRHAWVDAWFEEIERLLDQYDKEDIAYCGVKKLNFIRNLAFTVSRFTRFKLPETHNPDYSDYEEMLNQLLMEPADESGVLNPLANIVYYDYLGLLYMCLYDARKDPKDLEAATECFDLIMEKYLDHTDMSLGIWRGFVGFNLARCYIKKYNITKDVEYVKLAQKLFLKTSMVRKGWLTRAKFHSTIRAALSYEYFICKIEYINALKLLDTYTPEMILQEFKRLEGELETYMSQEEQLERLRYVHALLLSREEEADAADSISEALL